MRNCTGNAPHAVSLSAVVSDSKMYTFGGVLLGKAQNNVYILELGKLLLCTPPSSPTSFPTHHPLPLFSPAFLGKVLTPYIFTPFIFTPSLLTSSHPHSLHLHVLTPNISTPSLLTSSCPHSLHLHVLTPYISTPSLLTSSCPHSLHLHTLTHT